MAGAFSVGDWHVDPLSRPLTGANSDVRLEPKVMQVLVLLAKHQGEVVTKDVLFQAVWPDVFVGVKCCPAPPPSCAARSAYGRTTNIGSDFRRYGASPKFSSRYSWQF